MEGVAWDEANVSAEEAKEKEGTRVFGSDEDEGRQEGVEPPKTEGASETNGVVVPGR